MAGQNQAKPVIIIILTAIKHRNNSIKVLLLKGDLKSSKRPLI